MRQMVFANHNLHIHAKRIRRPQHLDHTPLRRSSWSGEVRDLHVHRQPFQRTVPFFQLLQTPLPLLMLRLLAQHAMRRRCRSRWNLRALRNQDRPAPRRARHPLIQRRHIVPLQHRRIVPRASSSVVAPPSARIVKDPHHRRIAPRQHPCPERRPSRPGGASSTSTSSPCIAPFSSLGGINKSSSRLPLPFGRTKPYPSRCRSSFPATSRSRVARNSCPPRRSPPSGPPRSARAVFSNVAP